MHDVQQSPTAVVLSAVMRCALTQGSKGNAPQPFYLVTVDDVGDMCFYEVAKGFSTASVPVVGVPTSSRDTAAAGSGSSPFSDAGAATQLRPPIGSGAAAEGSSNGTGAWGVTETPHTPRQKARLRCAAGTPSPPCGPLAERMSISGARVVDRGTRLRRPCFSMIFPSSGGHRGAAAQTLTSPVLPDPSSVPREEVVADRSNSSLLSPGELPHSPGEMVPPGQEVYFYVDDKMLKWRWIDMLQKMCLHSPGACNPHSALLDVASSPAVAAASGTGRTSLTSSPSVLRREVGGGVDGVLAVARAAESNAPEGLKDSPGRWPAPLAAGQLAKATEMPEHSTRLLWDLDGPVEHEQLEDVLRGAKVVEEATAAAANAQQTGPEMQASTASPPPENGSKSSSVAAAASPQLSPLSLAAGECLSPLGSPCDNPTDRFARANLPSHANRASRGHEAAAMARISRSPLFESCIENDPSNQECADCGELFPSWTVLQPFGVFVCIDCVGVHRSLWSNKCKEIELDHWADESIAFMRSRGNFLVNRELEYFCCSCEPREEDTSCTTVTSATAPAAAQATEVLSSTGESHSTGECCGAPFDSDTVSPWEDVDLLKWVPVYKPFSKYSSYAVRFKYISCKYRGMFSRRKNTPLGRDFVFPVYDPAGKAVARGVGLQSGAQGGGATGLPSASAGGVPSEPVGGPPRYIGVVHLHLKEAEGVLRAASGSTVVAVVANGFQELRTRPGRSSAPPPFPSTSLRGFGKSIMRQLGPSHSCGVEYYREQFAAAAARAESRESEYLWRKHRKARLAGQPSVRPPSAPTRGPSACLKPADPLQRKTSLRLMTPAFIFGSVSWDEVLLIGVDHSSRPLYITLYDANEDVLGTAVIVISDLYPPVGEEPHLMSAPISVPRSRPCIVARENCAQLVEATASAPLEQHITEQPLRSASRLSIPSVGDRIVDVDAVPPLLYFAISMQVMG